MVYKTNKMGGVNEKYEEKMPNVHVDIFSDILAFYRWNVHLFRFVLILISEYMCVYSACS